METNEKQEEAPKPEAKEAAAPKGDTTGDTGEGKPVENKPLSKLEEAREVSQKIDEGNKKLSENIERLEKLQAEDLLGGRTEAGQALAKTQEETDEEYVKRFQEGEVNPFKEDAKQGKD